MTIGGDIVPVGVFDSGHGGLTVTRVLLSRFPDRTFVYLGDHGRAPYGALPTETVVELTRAGVERLFDEGCRFVLVACNTAAAVALRRLQMEWLPSRAPDRRVLGVIVPTVEAITGVPWHERRPRMRAAATPRTIAVFGTVHTIGSGAFEQEIALRAPAVKVLQQACPALAGAIEEGASENVLDDLVRGYVQAVLDRLDGLTLDAAVLGCTHYPLIGHLFRRYLPAGVEIPLQPELTAKSLQAYLARHAEFECMSASGGPQMGCRYLTTGNPFLVSQVAQRFLGDEVVFEAAWGGRDERMGSNSA